MQKQHFMYKEVQLTDCELMWNKTHYDDLAQGKDSEFL